MQNLIDQFFNIAIMSKSLPLMLSGLWMTAKLCAAVILLGLIGGLLLSVANLSPRGWMRVPAILLTDIFRALPPLCLLLFLYFVFHFAARSN